MHVLINTGGGDAPGLNAVIRAATLSALRYGWKVSGIEYGYDGLLAGAQGSVIALDRDRVRGIAHLGGTILGTKNKGDPFQYPLETKDEVRLVDRSDEVIQRFRDIGADALITIGGDGSMRIAQNFADKGLPVVGVPKTIDNDLDRTAFTFGFQTAVDVATEAIGRLHSTAEAHRRVMVVEVMGRYAGWIALHAGLAGGADAILIPEIAFSVDRVCEKIAGREAMGRHFSIVVVAEGAIERGGSLSIREQEPAREVRLGGIGARLAQQIQSLTGKESREVVLGHLQRGGSPCSFDRLLATRFGAAATRLVAQGRFARMVAYQPPEITSVPIREAIAKRRIVDLESDTVKTAREIGIAFGD